MTGEFGSRQHRHCVHRLILMATTAAGIAGAAALIPMLGMPIGFPAAQAQSIARPVGFADIVAEVKPAVISVRIKRAAETRVTVNGKDLPFPKGSPLERFFRDFGFPDQLVPNGPRGLQRRQFVTGQGSGFFISADGYAVTNNHVVEKAETVEVVTDDGKTHKAKVIGTDPRTDLALIKLSDRSDYPFVKLADTEPRIGDWVLAVGNPFGLGGTVTAGILSARGRDIGAGPYDDFIQIDAPVNKGNSGGPTFDMNGHVIGVNTAIYSPSGGSVGIAFAIPAATVRSVVAQLRENGAVTRGWIGVKVQSVTSDIADSLGLKQARGALVAEPQADGPAAKAGMRTGDIITRVDGAEVESARDLAKKIGAIAPGSDVTLTVLRKGSEKTYTFALGKMPDQKQVATADTSSDSEDGAKLADLGLTVAPAGSVAGSGDAGVVVTAVDAGGPSAERGIASGDVILEVAGKPVTAPADLRKALAAAKQEGKKAILLRVKSSGGTRFVALPVGRA